MIEDLVQNLSQVKVDINVNVNEDDDDDDSDAKKKKTSAFGDIFAPAPKEELVKKRGWALLNAKRSEVVLLKTYGDVLKYSKMNDYTYKSNYRQGHNFYGVRDKISGDTFVVTVSLSKNLTVYGSKGERVQYFME